MSFYYDDQLASESNTIKLMGGDDYKIEIARAIYSDDFEFEVTNTWSDFNAGNPLEAAWEGAKSKFSGYMGIATNLGKAAQDEGYFKASSGDNWLSTALKSAGKFVASGRAQEYMNKSLVVQGTRFIYYSGTNITMGNMQLKYTLMYDPVKDLTIQDQLDKVIPYAVGDYKTITEIRQAGGKKDNELVTEAGTLLGWQDPPGKPAYEANYKNVDSVHKGTLKLIFGDDQYSIDNLVVTNLTVVASRARVKRKTKSSGNNTPLYADVALTFRPAGIITRNKLREYLKINN